MNASTSMTRRNALKTITVKTAAMAVGLNRLKAAVPTVAAPSLHVYPDYGWLRGFNCIPSWGARVEDAWWFYDGAKMREEMALARSVHANAICLWIEFTAWFRDPERVTASFLDAIAAIDENGMKAMPCLFNRWHNPLYDYGGTYVDHLLPAMPTQREYLQAVVTPLAADARVFCWNLCNEPAARLPGHTQRLTETQTQRELAWLKNVAGVVRECGVRQPITIGTMDGQPDRYGSIEFYAPLVDVLCGHPYCQSRDDLAVVIAHYQSLRARLGKPLLCNEGVPGSEVDEVRGETHRFHLEMLGAAGFGLMPWSIKEGRSIAARRDRMDGNGVGGKGFHPTFTKNNQLRAGHDWMREQPKLRAPWELDQPTRACGAAKLL